MNGKFLNQLSDHFRNQLEYKLHWQLYLQLTFKLRGVMESEIRKDCFTNLNEGLERKLK